MNTSSADDKNHKYGIAPAVDVPAAAAFALGFIGELMTVNPRLRQYQCAALAGAGNAGSSFAGGVADSGRRSAAGSFNWSSHSRSCSHTIPLAAAGDFSGSVG